MSTQLSLPNLPASTHQSSTPLFLLSRPYTSNPVKEYSTSNDPTKPLAPAPNVSYSSSSSKLHAAFNGTTGLGSRLPAPAPPALAPWPGTPRHHRTQARVRRRRVSLVLELAQGHGHSDSASAGGQTTWRQEHDARDVPDEVEEEEEPERQHGSVRGRWSGSCVAPRQVPRGVHPRATTMGDDRKRSKCLFFRRKINARA